MIRAGELAVAVLVLSAGALAAADATVTRGPYLQALLDTSVEVIWRTEVESVGAVRFHEVGGAELSVAEAQPALQHHIKLSSLKPGTAYMYQVLDGNRLIESDAFHFRTAPPAGTGEIHVAVVGDSGDASDEERAIAALIRGMAPDILVHTGDFDYEEGDLDKSVFGPFHEVIAGACFYPARGNHEFHLDWSDVLFPPNLASSGDHLYYSFDWGSAHFAAFDTNQDALTGGDQLRWLEGNLEAARSGGQKWLIVFMHEPVYTVGGYSIENLVAHQVIPPIADRLGVDLVLSGHDHNYQRSHPARGDVVHDAWQSPAFVSPMGTIYLVSGGGGRQLYSERLQADHRFTRLFLFEHHALELVITPQEIQVRALSPENLVLDEFTLTKERPRPELRLIRGDADGDGVVDIADAIGILGHLFLGTTIECRAFAKSTADVNNSDAVAIDDAIFLLDYLFLGGPAPPQPYPDCGVVPGSDDAWCTKSACR